MNELKIENVPELPFDVEEAVNQLRISIGFCGDNIKVIMLTSSMPNEGKSFIAMHLWKQMADVGLKTLLIDCDLRNSEMRAKNGIHAVGDEKIMGIAHYLAGKVPLQNALYKTSIPRGYMIPLATCVSNPSILFENERFGAMIEECRKIFDYVIIDTPPLANVADALTVAGSCDGSILVVRSGETPKKAVENTLQLLNRTEIPLLGVVLNRADASGKSSPYYRRYYNRYGYYNKYGYGDGK